MEKYNMNNYLTGLLIQKLAGRYNRRPPPRSRPDNWSSNVPIATKIARKRNNGRNPRRRFGKPELQRGGIEVNRNEGGFKNITQGLMYMTRSVDFFADLNLAAQAGGASYLIASSSELDLASTLISLPEFQIFLLSSVKYRFLGVRISVDYSTVVPANTHLGKLILTPKTDLIEIADPKANHASMILDMSHPGVKNFNFNLNKNNMLEDNVDWIKSSTPYPGTLRLSVSTQSANQNGASGMIKLGCIKISFIIKFAMQDLTSLVTKLSKVIQENKTMKEEQNKISEIAKGLVQP
jgi:hypothetical protein